MKYYRIYAKLQNENRFKAVDWKEGVQVNNLIRATIIDERFLQKAIDTIDASVELNHNIVFQIREVDSQKVIHVARK